MRVGMSEDRVSHLSRLVVDQIWKDDLVDYSSEEQALRSAKKGLQEHVDMMSEIDNLARAKVASLKRGVAEGSSEWEVLYQKYFEEEMKRHGQS